MYSFNTALPTTPSPAQSSATLTAADGFAWLEAAGSGLDPARLANRRSALCAYVRAARPAGDRPRTRAALRRDAALVPLECAAVRAAFYGRPLHETGLPSERRRDAVVSLLRGVMGELGVHDPELPAAAALAPAWTALHAPLSPERRKGLIGFMGWCSVQGIAPSEVDDATLAAFETWSVKGVVHRNPHERARRTASNWNWARRHVPDWPTSQLTRVGMRDDYALPWSAYAPALQAEAERFLAGLAVVDDGDIADMAFGVDEAGEPTRPHGLRRALRPRTVQTRRDCLKIALTALVAAGHAPETLRLVDLVQPLANVKAVLVFHRRRAWERRVANLSPEEAAAIPVQDIRTPGLANIGETLRQLARFHFALPEPAVARIGELVARVKPRTQMSMSEKNRRRMSALAEPAVYARLALLPGQLMRQAGERVREQPRAAALLAMHGVALEILTIFPIRRANLGSLRLDRHLQREAGGGAIAGIFVPAEEVKNAEKLECPLPTSSAALLERYLREFRPHLAEAGNPFLFPGSGQRVRSAHDLAIRLKELVQPAIRAEFTVHLMRHLAVYRLLRANPGQYEVARRLLGHRRMETTRAFYAGLETVFAAKAFTDLVEAERRSLSRGLPRALTGRGR